MSLVNYLSSISSNNGKIINNQSDFDNLTVEANDTIIFKSDVYGSLNINQNNVTVIGGGNTIIGSQSFAPSWTDNLDGTYQAANTQPDWITKDNALMTQAETPWIAQTGSPAANQLTVSHGDVSAYGDIVGATLLNKDRAWRVYAYTVIAYDGAGLITLEQNQVSEYSSLTGDIKLLGRPSMFQNNNEWAWDGTNIVIKSALEPTGIRIIDVDSVLTINADNANISNLKISEFYQTGIIRETGNNLQVISCEVSEGRGCGVLLNTYEINSTIDNNNIHDIAFCGISVSTAKEPIVTNNIITNIGMQSNYGWDNIRGGRVSATANSGIVLTGWEGGSLFPDGGNISNNIINNIAYCGIAIVGINNVIRYNYVTNAMQRYVDGGGIYSVGTNAGATNNTYEYNFVSGCVGSYDGTDVIASTARAIHMDDDSIQSTIRFNTFWDCQQTTLLKGKDHTVNNNIFDGELQGWEWVTQATQTPTMINDNNQFNDNILISRIAASIAFSTDIRASDPDYNPYAAGGAADNNYYINPYGTVIGDDTNFGNMTLAQLKTLYAQDVNSIEHTNYITAPGDPDNEILLISNPSASVLNGTAPAGTWKDVDGVLTTNYSIAAWRSLVLLKDLP